MLQGKGGAKRHSIPLLCFFFCSRFLLLKSRAHREEGGGMFFGGFFGLGVFTPPSVTSGTRATRSDTNETVASFLFFFSFCSLGLSIGGKTLRGTRKEFKGFEQERQQHKSTIGKGGPKKRWGKKFHPGPWHLPYRFTSSLSSDRLSSRWRGNPRSQATVATFPDFCCVTVSLSPISICAPLSPPDFRKCP